jgi:hypothetical protein
LALTVESAKESGLPGLIAALQVTLKDLQLLAPEQRVRWSEIVSMLGEWPTDRLSAPWPPPPPTSRPRLNQTRGKKREPGSNREQHQSLKQ